MLGAVVLLVVLLVSVLSCCDVSNACYVVVLVPGRLLSCMSPRSASLVKFFACWILSCADVVGC